MDIRKDGWNMTNQCTDCGADLIEGSKFCTACGKDVEQKPEAPSQPEPEQPVEQKKPTAPPKMKKKLKKSWLIGILVIVVIIVIGAALAVYLMGQGGTSPLHDNRFIGNWQQITDLSLSVWRFNNDGTFGITPPSSILMNGTWTTSGNLLCFNNNTVCYSFFFSDSGNNLTLNKTGQNLILSKNVLQGTTQTPNIECSSDAATNRITIDSISPNVKWSDITITTDNANASWQVQDKNQKGLARIGYTSTITVYMSAGDSILVLGATGDVTVTLKFKPTNAVLGHWTVNV